MAHTWRTHENEQPSYCIRVLHSRLKQGDLAATRLWPRCWERSGWEEAAVLLTGFYAEDSTPVIDWLAQAQPEVAALCILNSGAQTPPATLLRLRQAWLPRLTDIEADPEPEVRAVFGRALGRLKLDDAPLDNRKGVGLRVDAQQRRVPDIDWVEIPAGACRYQGKKLTLPGFYMARYPITHCQFQAFVDDPAGFSNSRWWVGLARQDQQPDMPYWDYTNHPRETVTWYAAVAYCRWLSAMGVTDLQGDVLELSLKNRADGQMENL